MAMKKLVLILAMALVGCATSQEGRKFEGKFERPSAERITAIGPQPANIEDQAKTFLIGKLKDPESARFKTSSAPYRAYTNSLWMLGAGGEITWIGWAIDLEYNAKNSYGGYVGFSCETVSFSSGRPVKAAPCFRPQPWDAPIFTKIQ
jgi:hypothetical protein